MDNHEISADTRSQVHYIDDKELAYTMQRYREVHDFFHTLFGIPISVEAEIALKYVEFFQTTLPMNLLASLVGPFSLTFHEKKNFIHEYLPWACKAALNSKFLLNI
eukprot:Sdes_comp20290_c0_seq3m13879